MNLYVDDVRPCPDGWALARTYHDAMRLLSRYEYDIVSLDHDLGGGDDFFTQRPGYGEREMTGYDIMCAIERGETKQPKEIVCHSWNPAGKANIERAIAQWRRKRDERAATTSGEAQ